jgi:peptidyl-prolyl cis-trans isomerase SurA
MGTSALAQDAGDSLKLPEDMSRSSRTAIPHLHKPTAVVNGQIITKTDVDQRLALLSCWRTAARCLTKKWHGLRLQVLRNLIDETLQIQEAAANDIIVQRQELEESFARSRRPISDNRRRTLPNI